MTSRGQKWTPKNDEKLKKLYAITPPLSTRQIAVELDCGYSRNAVIGRIHRLNLPLRGHRKPEPRVRVKPARIEKIRMVRANSNSNAIRIIESATLESAVLRCAEVEPRNLQLTDLGPDECKYAYGDGPFLFCGHPKIDGCSYCGPHFDLTRKHTRTIDEAVTEARRRRMRGINFRKALLEVAP
jgi:GcrA cell cycle regulator